MTLYLFFSVFCLFISLVIATITLYDKPNQIQWLTKRSTYSHDQRSTSQLQFIYLNWTQLGRYAPDLGSGDRISSGLFYMFVLPEACFPHGMKLQCQGQGHLKPFVHIMTTNILLAKASHRPSPTS